MLDKRNILIYLSIKFKGDWNAIYDALLGHVEIDVKEAMSLSEDIINHTLTILDDNYPECLSHIYHPPFVLYYQGDISLLNKGKKKIGVVGSRKASAYGLKCTEDILKDIVQDIITVSGLAIGIDGKAHATSLKYGGRTIAVLGSGLNYTYPNENINLYRWIRKKDLLISEYPDEVPPAPGNFPQRNRIIVGLSDGLFVPEIYNRSGTSCSVAYALMMNKDVMCPPHPYDSECICNRLIHDGAFLVQNGQDILDVIGEIKNEKS